MTILNHPSALELSGNLTRFRISSAEAFTFVLKKGSEVLLSQVYNPGSTGIVEIDVREAVESKLSYLFQDASAIYEQVNLVGTFTATIDATVITFTAIRSGVDRFADSATNFLTANFLTWQPQVKHVTYYSPEFLTYYSPAGGIAKLVAHYSDDTTEVLTIGSLASGKAYTIPLQYATVNSLLTKKLPAYYDVYVTNAGGDRLSYIQRFAASNIKSEDERWFLFENSLGGLDTIRAYGADGFTGEHTHNIADIDEVAEEYRVDTSRIYSKNTGYLDDYERRWLLDFFPSKKKYVYTQSTVRQIVVTESDVDYNSKDLPSAYSFKYRFSEAKPYLNLSRVDEIPDEITLYTPDIGSFTLPLRLNDLPHIELTEGALIPGQNPYSEHAGVFSVAELIAYLKSSEQLDVAFVKRSATGATIEGNGKVFGVDVDADGNLVFQGNIYATGSVSAQGVGTGGGGTSYNRLDTWDAYVPGTTDTWVLSALLGHDLHTRVTALESDTTNVVWGVPTTDYVTLTVNAVSRQLSVHGHGHTFASLTSKPTTIAGYGITDSLIYEGDARLTNSRPASDVYAWAKAATKPSYSYTEVGAAAASHYHDDRYFQKGELFTKEGSGTEGDPYRIRANFPFYGISSVAALGIGTGGGGGTSYDRLDSWTGYDVDQAGWVLSAGLGHDTYTRVLALEASTPNVAWGVDGSGYTPLTVNGITRQLSTNGHTHGNVSNDGKIGTTANLVIVTGTGGALAAKTAGTNSQFLRGDGSWATPPDTIYTHPNSGVSAGTYKSVTVNAAGHVTGGTNPTTLAGYGITDAMSTSHAANGITATNITNWGTAYTNNHTHTNKSLLDAFSQGNANVLSHLFIDANGKLYTDVDFYSQGSSSALGIGTGGGGTAYDRLDTWASYDSSKAGWVLSALLGVDLNGRVTALEGSTPNVAWGVPTTQYVPLTINSVSRQLSLNGHTHTKSQITDFPSSWDWSAIDNKPPTYTPSAHTHDDRYYTETEIGNLFAGTTAITGYNKGNWDGVVTDFAGLEIGGRNLFPMTKLRAIGFWNESVQIGTGSDAIFSAKGTGWTILPIALATPIIPPNTDFIVSFEVRNTQAGFGFEITNTSSTVTIISRRVFENPTNEWVRMSSKYNSGSSAVIGGINIYNQGDIRRIKFEKGNIPTDWTPAPEDVDASIAAVQTNLDTHAALTNNPHSVTATQVGLGNVENTALSTWAGSGNITTLGTVTTGTWNANTIAVTKGGTGKTSVAANSMLYATANDAYGEVATTAFGRGLLSAVSETEVTGLRAATATKLATARTIFGQSFDGSGNVTGNATLGTTDATYLQVGAIRLQYDATNNAIKVIKSDGTAANFYATGSNTAFGIGTGGGGSSYNMVSDWSQYVAGSEQWVVSAQLINAIRTSVTGHIGDGTHASAGEKSNWNAAYSHSVVSGGVHMTTTDRSQLTTAFTNNHTHSNKADLDGISATNITNWGTAYSFANGFETNYPDLVAIEAIAGTSGLLKKTAANTWSLDTNTYLTGITKAQVEAVLTGGITSHDHSFSSITSKPTTVSGYGITDVWTSNTVQTFTTGIKYFSDSSLLRHDVTIGSGQLSFSHGQSIVNSPLGYDTWHDHFAFLRVHTIVDKEYSNDGAVWSQSTLNIDKLFSQQENANTTILTAENRAFRFTISSSYFHASQITWYEIGYNWVASAPYCTVVIESSIDKTTWTTLHSSQYSASVSTRYLSSLGLPSDQRYIRFTFTKTTLLTTGTVSLNCIKGLTFRKGSQGLGKEYELPMSWTADGTLIPIRTASELGSSTLKWANVHATVFTENGVLLSSKYAALAGTSTQDFAAKNLAVAGTSITTGMSAMGLATPYAYAHVKGGIITENPNYGVGNAGGTTTQNRAGIVISSNHATNNSVFWLSTDATVGNALNIGIGNTFNDTNKRLSLSHNGLLTASNFATANADGAYMQVGPIKILYDATNNAIRVEGNLYAMGSNTAFGIGGGSGGGGLITNVYNSAGFGGTYSDVDLSSTFNAYAINSLYTALQGKAASDHTHATLSTGDVAFKVQKLTRQLTPSDISSGMYQFSGAHANPSKVVFIGCQVYQASNGSLYGDTLSGDGEYFLHPVAAYNNNINVYFESADNSLSPDDTLVLFLIYTL